MIQGERRAHTEAYDGGRLAVLDALVSVFMAEGHVELGLK